MTGGSAICVSKDEKDEKDQYISWTIADSKFLKIDIVETTKPFQLGGFSIGWDGELVGTLNSSRKWYIKPNGGASFSWLSSGSISCSKLTVGGTNISNKLSSLESGLSNAFDYCGTNGAKINTNTKDITDLKATVKSLDARIKILEGYHNK